MRDRIIQKAKLAQSSSRVLANVSSDQKNFALVRMAEKLVDRKDYILEANRVDLENAYRKDYKTAFIDRLTLNEKRIYEMADSLKAVAELPDPVGEIVTMWKRPNGLQIGQMRVPIGVIGIIYESRPNVTVDATGLCLKSGNAVILRGGSEALNSNIVLVDTLREALREAQLPEDAVQIIDMPEREAVDIMMKLNDYIDLLIPRGGAGLIKNVIENSTIPVVETGVGNCHTYVDKDADLEKAKNICFNAKVQRPGVCNAMETLLVHKDISHQFLPEMIEMFKNAGVEIRGCEKTLAICPEVKPATEEDWYTEYLDLILAVKVVESVDEAIEHIYKYGTKHSEAIVTENYTVARKFLNEVDAACVYVNASTRFTDGFQFGFGGEIGISTQKLHARGPMGLKELTTIKYIILGDGQVRK